MYDAFVPVWSLYMVITTRLCLTLNVTHFSPDCVVRTHYYKYFHPKECLVANGILNRAIALAAGKYSASDQYDHNNSQ